MGLNGGKIVTDYTEQTVYETESGLCDHCFQSTMVEVQITVRTYEDGYVEQEVERALCGRCRNG